MKSKNKITLAGPWLAFVMVACATIALGTLDYSWQGWRAASCVPEHCFCEAIRPGVVAQPVNAYSNLAYVLVGLLVIGAAWRAHGAKANLMRQHKAYPMLCGIAVVSIGLGSLFYHASLTFVGQWFDLAGMYLFATFIMLYNLSRLRPMSGKVFVLVYVAANLVLGIAQITQPGLRRQMFAGLIALTIALEVLALALKKPAIKIVYFVAALGAFGAAYGIWILDETRQLCAPMSWLQGHAAWHVLSAIAAWLLYLYYGSEGESKLSSIDLASRTAPWAGSST